MASKQRADRRLQSSAPHRARKPRAPPPHPHPPPSSQPCSGLCARPSTRLKCTTSAAPDCVWLSGLRPSLGERHASRSCQLVCAVGQRFRASLGAACARRLSRLLSCPKILPKADTHARAAENSAREARVDACHALQPPSNKRARHRVCGGCLRSAWLESVCLKINQSGPAAVGADVAAV